MQTWVVRPSWERRIPLLEIEAHDAGRKTAAAIGDIAPLRRRDPRIVELREQTPKPALMEDDVLIDLTDDRKTCRENAGVERGRGAMPRLRRSIATGLRREIEQDVPRFISASVVDDDDLHRAAVGLKPDGFDDVADPAVSVSHGHDEADRRNVVVRTRHEIKARYSRAISLATTSPP